MLIDGGFFALLLLSFALGDLEQRRSFADAQRLLDVHLGVLNTMLLLTSSWSVANAMHNARRASFRSIRRFLVLGAACGLAFAVVKMFEYGAHIAAGMTAATNDFFMFYFTITAIHLAHVLAGVVLLFVMASRSARYGPDHMLGLEIGAIYWHFVDLVWVIIFPMLYLVRWQ